MSVVRCDGAGCVNRIDTDQDDECLVPDPRHSLAGHPDLHLCPKCRGRMQANLDAGDAAAGMAELNQALGSGRLK